MKTILVLWIVTSTGATMTTRTLPNMDACETAGRMWQGSAVTAPGLRPSLHGYACLATAPMN